MTRVTALVFFLWISPFSTWASTLHDGREAGGEHRRLMTQHGAVHVWMPARYDVRKAGIVVYVHGFFTSADEAWEEHRLAEQFAASGRNALFIVPEAPGSLQDPIAWPSLAALLRTVREATGNTLPAGPVVVTGHSGAFHTIVPWLGNTSIRSLLLIDALYRYENEFARWLAHGTRKAPRQMILIGQETHSIAEAFIRRFPDAARRQDIPIQLDRFSPRERKARLLYMRSQYDHMELVTTGKVIPLLLQLTPLPGILGTVTEIPNSKYHRLPLRNLGISVTVPKTPRLSSLPGFGYNAGL
ncbi:MAG: hypothetical protein ABSH28_12240 [Acidobacteriota bacterium]|jgi:hypothetical protein